jgi:hypothetical protein
MKETETEREKKKTSSTEVMPYIEKLQEKRNYALLKKEREGNALFKKHEFKLEVLSSAIFHTVFSHFISFRKALGEVSKAKV